MGRSQVRGPLARADADTNFYFHFFYFNVNLNWYWSWRPHGKGHKGHNMLTVTDDVHMPLYIYAMYEYEYMSKLMNYEVIKYDVRTHSVFINSCGSPILRPLLHSSNMPNKLHTYI